MTFDHAYTAADIGARLYCRGCTLSLIKHTGIYARDILHLSPGLFTADTAGYADRNDWEYEPVLAIYDRQLMDQIVTNIEEGG